VTVSHLSDGYDVWLARLPEGVARPTKATERPERARVRELLKKGRDFEEAASFVVSFNEQELLRPVGAWAVLTPALRVSGDELVSKDRMTLIPDGTI
jgi:hypothetical protein